jgi:hypothetical protein
MAITKWKFMYSDIPNAAFIVMHSSKASMFIYYKYKGLLTEVGSMFQIKLAHFNEI